MDSPEAFRVVEARCRKDGICAAVCPVRIITGKAGEVPFVAAEKAPRCIRCGQCMAFCPTLACAAPGLSFDDARFLHKDRYPEPEKVEELVFARRSIRNYREKTVPRELTLRILDAVRFAPTGHNCQDLRWVVTSDREETATVARIVVDWLRDLPATDPAYAEEMHAGGLVKRWDAGQDLITRGAPHVAIVVGRKRFITEIYDAGAALTYFEILALAHGVGCCWGGYISYALAHPAGSALRGYLGIGDHERGYSAQLFGYPKFAATSRPPREGLRVTWK